MPIFAWLRVDELCGVNCKENVFHAESTKYREISKFAHIYLLMISLGLMYLPTKHFCCYIRKSSKV